MNKIKNLLKYFGKIWDKKKDVDNLSNLLIEKLSQDDENKKINEKDYVGYVDKANVLMVIPKKEWLNELIKNNFEVEGDKEKTERIFNSMDYTPDKWEEISCLYTPEYMNLIFNLTKGYDALKIKTKKDTPLFVECKDFIILLAPRNDEEEI